MEIDRIPGQTVEANQLPLIENTVPGHYKCQTINAQWLCIWDLSYEEKHFIKFDIGGTYSEDIPDVWFYYTIKKYNCDILMTVFALHRSPGILSIGISDTNKIGTAIVQTSAGNPKHCFLPSALTWKTFASLRSNTSYHINTYCFNEEQMKFLQKKTLCIKVTIKLNPKELNNDMEKTLKRKHYNAINSFMKQKKTDFILESSSRKEYPTHKLLLVASSPVLRDMIRSTDTTVAFIDINDDKMRFMLQWVQTGTIEDIENQNASDIIEVADKFKFSNLKDLMATTLAKQVNIDNAIEFAVFSKKYNLEYLQKVVLKFIKNNEQVLKTPAWNNLKDVELTKCLLESIM